jgi:1,4-dihydroxy-6-naphthoate synthase
VVLEDIQTLNQWSDSGKLEITKLSFPAFFRNESQYAMLPSGGALGKGVGPLLVAKKMVNVPDIDHCSIAIPGEHTTANFLMNFAFPRAKNKTALVFSEIEDAVAMGKFDLGVIIHENRFTYHQKGLIKVCDLGEVWEHRQQMPIPLACIAVKKTVNSEVQKRLGQLIRNSVEYAFSHYPEITEYTKQHAQTMNEDVMRKHIELYVNNYSLDLGDDGRGAILALRTLFQQLGKQ